MGRGVARWWGICDFGIGSFVIWGSAAPAVSVVFFAAAIAEGFVGSLGRLSPSSE